MSLHILVAILGFVLSLALVWCGYRLIYFGGTGKFSVIVEHKGFRAIFVNTSPGVICILCATAVFISMTYFLKIWAT